MPFIHNFIFGLGLSSDLKKLAWPSALTSKLWPRPQDPSLDRPPSRDFGLV